MVEHVKPLLQVTLLEHY
jgi:hypothetical protein